MPLSVIAKLMLTSKQIYICEEKIPTLNSIIFKFYDFYCCFTGTTTRSTCGPIYASRVRVSSVPLSIVRVRRVILKIGQPVGQPEKTGQFSGQCLYCQNIKVEYSIIQI